MARKRIVARKSAALQVHAERGSEQSVLSAVEHRLQQVGVDQVPFAMVSVNMGTNGYASTRLPRAQVPRDLASVVESMA